jgi:RNA polymerase sigma-70 factor (ECF subfamily)
MPYLRSRPALLTSFREGDREAMSEVYWAYVERVERVVKRLLPRADLPDVVQEVFMRAFAETGRRGYDGLRDYAPYLLTIARNIVIDRARRACRELPTDELPVIEAAEEEPEAWDEPETMRIVDTYLRELSPDLRAIHAQRYERGLPQREAAAELGISRQQLRTREARLRAGLADALRKADRI